MATPKQIDWNYSILILQDLKKDTGSNFLLFQASHFHAVPKVSLLPPFELYRALIVTVFLLLIEHKNQPWHVLDFTDAGIKPTQIALVLQTNVSIIPGVPCNFCFLLL